MNNNNNNIGNHEGNNNANTNSSRNDNNNNGDVNTGEIEGLATMISPNQAMDRRGRRRTTIIGFRFSFGYCY